MKFYSLARVFLLWFALTASFYEPLRAMEDSTTTAKPSVKTTFIGCWSLRTIPSGSPFGMGQKISQDFTGSIPAISYPGFSIAPVHTIWSNNLNAWINELSYNLGFYNAASNNMTYSCFTHEISWGVGYAVVNSPRFRLYPMLSVKVVFDELRFAKPTTMTTLFSTFEPSSISLQRFVGIPEIAIGADYRFPTNVDNYDVFVVAKVGYNFISFDSPWAHGGRTITDADAAWFSRRGVFFQLGIGFGSERQ